MYLQSGDLCTFGWKKLEKSRWENPNSYVLTDTVYVALNFQGRKLVIFITLNGITKNFHKNLVTRAGNNNQRVHKLTSRNIHDFMRRNVFLEQNSRYQERFLPQKFGDIW